MQWNDNTDNYIKLSVVKVAYTKKSRATAS